MPLGDTNGVVVNKSHCIGVDNGTTYCIRHVFHCVVLGGMRSILGPVHFFL